MQYNKFLSALPQTGIYLPGNNHLTQPDIEDDGKFKFVTSSILISGHIHFLFIGPRRKSQKTKVI
jgi:hypothetical protein